MTFESSVSCSQAGFSVPDQNSMYYEYPGALQLQVHIKVSCYLWSETEISQINTMKYQIWPFKLLKIMGWRDFSFYHAVL